MGEVETDHRDIGCHLQVAAKAYRSRAKSWAIHCLHLGPCRTGRAGRPRGEYILERDVVTRYLERRGSEFFAGNLVEIWRGSRESWRREREAKRRERVGAGLANGIGHGDEKFESRDAMGWQSWFPRRKELVVVGGGQRTMEVATCSNYLPTRPPLCSSETRRRFSGQNRGPSRLNDEHTHTAPRDSQD